MCQGASWSAIRMLEEALGTREELAETLRHDDLDELIGVWSATEAEEFDDALAKQREIDPEMWGVISTGTSSG